MMLHQDGSRHVWIEGLEAMDLIVTMDDATSTIYSAFLIEEEGMMSTFQGLIETCTAHGLPSSLYADRIGASAAVLDFIRAEGPDANTAIAAMARMGNGALMDYQHLNPPIVHTSATGDRDTARASATLVDIAPARRREQARRRAREGQVAETPEQIRARMLQNIGAMLVVIALVTGGVWLIVQLRESLRMETCLESGRRNCAPIDTTPLPPAK